MNDQEKIVEVMARGIGSSGLDDFTDPSDLVERALAALEKKGYVVVNRRVVANLVAIVNGDHERHGGGFSLLQEPFEAEPKDAG